MADLAVQIAEAEAGLHKLMTGSMPQTVSYGDRTVTYTRAQVPELREYIASLKQRQASEARVFTVQSKRGIA